MNLKFIIIIHDLTRYIFHITMYVYACSWLLTTVWMTCFDGFWASQHQQRKSVISVHSSEIRVLYLMKLSSKTLQCWNVKTHVVFVLFFISCYFIFFYVDIDQEEKIAWNETRKKLCGFLVFQKYGKYWSVPLDNLIKHITLISEE